MTLTKPLHPKNLMLNLRQELGLSQQKFAALLGVSFKTVNRWENGHTMPSPMALRLIKNLLHSMGETGKALLNQYFSEVE